MRVRYLMIVDVKVLYFSFMATQVSFVISSWSANDLAEISFTA